MNALTPTSVLIVEDEGIIALDLQQTLRDFGYDAYAIASSADEAIAAASKRCPDIVLMDIHIKGSRDGVETAQILKDRFAVPVVYLTAHADDRTLARVKQTAPHGYLLKPVKATELRSAIEVALYKNALETRLRERERWYSTTLRSIADAVISVDMAGRVTFMNPAAEVLTGVPAATAAGKPIREVLLLLQLAAGDELPPLKALREGQAVALQESTLVNAASGDRLLISDSAAPVIDTGQTLGAVMVFRDVTLQKKLQQQLELADRLASLGTLAAGVAHEINNPLAVITGNTHLLAEELKEMWAHMQSRPASGPEADQRQQRITQSIEDVQAATTRIGRIVADLGVFSRPAPVSAGQADVVRCVEWAVRTTEHEFRQRARLVTDLGEVVPVKADEARLDQVLINLLMNAAQAIEPGKTDHNRVTVATRMVSDGRVAIEVRDTGAGIPREALRRIFEPFFTTKQVGVGTGLGLAICHGIVSALGGEIEVQSEMGKGTVVRVLLLAATPAATPAEASPLDGVAVVRARILVVEDEGMVRRVLERVLGDHDLCSLERGGDALARIDAGESFDLILCDLMMPTMSGIELYERLLKTNPDLARRVVFITGGATTAEVHAFLRSVPNPRIQKPFEVDELREMVQRLLQSGRGPAQPLRPLPSARASNDRS